MEDIVGNISTFFPLLFTVEAELKDLFVLIESLGDFSVTYKAAGFYENVEHLLSTKSALKASVLDSLHEADVEIVSPAFMNQRVLDKDRSFIPQQTDKKEISAAQIFPESKFFDKANQVKKLEMLEEKRESLLEEIKELKNSKHLTDDLQARIDQLESHVKIAEA